MDSATPLVSIPDDLHSSYTESESPIDKPVIRVVLIKMLCILVAIVLSFVTTLKSATSLGMFQASPTPSVNALREAFDSYIKFVTNESSTIKSTLREQFEHQFSTVNFQCNERRAEAEATFDRLHSHVEKHSDSYCENLIDRIWREVERNELLPRYCFERKECQNLAPSNCTLMWQVASINAAANNVSSKVCVQLAVGPKPLRDACQDFDFDAAGPSLLPCRQFSQHALNEFSGVAEFAMQMTIDDDKNNDKKQNAIQRRLSYDKEYIKKYCGSVSALHGAQVTFDSCIAVNAEHFKGIRARFDTTKAKLGVRVQSLNDRLAMLKQVTAHIKSMNAVLPPNLLPLSKVKNLNPIRLGDVGEFPEISLSSLTVGNIGLNDYNPPPIDTHNALPHMREKVEEKLKRATDRLQEQRERPPTSSFLRMPKFVTYFSDAFSWMTGILSWFLTADILFRLVTCARYVGIILNAKRRDMTSMTRKFRRILSIVCSYSTIVFLLLFILIFVIKAAVALSHSEWFDVVSEEIETYCHNRVVLSSETDRENFAERLSKARGECNAHLDVFNARLAVMHVGANTFNTRVKEFERMFKSLPTTVGENDEHACGVAAQKNGIIVQFQVESSEAHLSPIQHKNIEFVNCTALENKVIDVPTCRHSQEVRILLQRMRHFASALYLAFVVRFIVSLLLTFASAFTMTALQRYFWLELTTGYDTDGAFSEDDVRQKAAQHRFNAKLFALGAIIIFIFVIFIGYNF